MISPDTLRKYGFVRLNNNKVEFFYGDWDYMYNTNTHELYDINDGFGEPQLIAKIENLEHLIMVMYFHCDVELKIE